MLQDWINFLIMENRESTASEMTLEREEQRAASPEPSDDEAETSDLRWDTIQ